jgi:hypothetical protein
MPGIHSRGERLIQAVEHIVIRQLERKADLNYSAVVKSRQQDSGKGIKSEVVRFWTTIDNDEQNQIIMPSRSRSER